VEHNLYKHKMIELGPAASFLEQIERVKRHIEELLTENEKCKLRLSYLESLAATQTDAESIQSEKARNLREKIAHLEETIINLNEKYDKVQKENIAFAEHYLKIEEHNNNLANLYIASYQLHTTLDFRETVQIVMEIIMNLVGAEAFALYLLDPDEQVLSLIAAEGNSEFMPRTVPAGEGIIGSVALAGQSHYVADIVQQRLSNEPLAVIPLKIRQEVIGVIAIFKLLVQKSALNSLDNNLFELLAGHAATALFSSQLYTSSARKHKTLKTFLDLMKTSQHH